MGIAPRGKRRLETARRRTVTANADRFAADLAPVIAAIRAEGHTSLRTIAAELNARGILTRRGGRWQVSNVRGLMAWIGDRFAER